MISRHVKLPDPLERADKIEDIGLNTKVSKMATRKPRVDDGIENIPSEEDDRNSSPAIYQVVTYPADYTLEGLVQKLKDELIEFPKFQRKFVWTHKQSSRLIESFLQGLPVPAIFLYRDREEEKMHVIDGQQRLRTIAAFFDGTLETGGKHIPFNLVELAANSPYEGKSYQAIRNSDATAYNRLNNAVLRSFVVEQIRPKDNSSIYHIFERLNTGGTLLVGQEIRNCIYAGPLNDFLNQLNKNQSWREIFGKKTEDGRMRDVELILRFFAILYPPREYTKPMKTFLNDFMAKHRSAKKELLSAYREVFEKTVTNVLSAFGEKPFHLASGLNAAAFDAVFVAFAQHKEKPMPGNIFSRYKKLKRTKKFLEYVTSSTTDELVISRRLSKAKKILFG